MKYYLLFIIFNLIRNRDSCYKEDSHQEFNKENCFIRRNFSEEETIYMFGEKPDSCCYVKKTFSIEGMEEELKEILKYGQIYFCRACPKSQIKKIIKLEKLNWEFWGVKNVKVSIDCLAFISKINKFILIILIIII